MNKKVLDSIQKEAEMLVELLKDRQPGIMIWCDFFHERLQNLKNLTSSVILEKTLEQKWSSYRGIGIMSRKGKNILVLCERIGGGEFAIVELFDGSPQTSSKMKVVEEIKTADIAEALKRFKEVAKNLRFKGLPRRMLANFH